MARRASNVLPPLVRRRFLEAYADYGDPDLMEVLRAMDAARTAKRAHRQSSKPATDADVFEQLAIASRMWAGDPDPKKIAQTAWQGLQGKGRYALQSELRDLLTRRGKARLRRFEKSQKSQNP